MQQFLLTQKECGEIEALLLQSNVEQIYREPNQLEYLFFINTPHVLYSIEHNGRYWYRWMSKEKASREIWERVKQVGVLQAHDVPFECPRTGIRWDSSVQVRGARLIFRSSGQTIRFFKFRYGNKIDGELYIPEGSDRTIVTGIKKLIPKRPFKPLRERVLST